jgi:hypothetical protein
VTFHIPPIFKKCPVVNGEQYELTGSSEAIDLHKKLLRKVFTGLVWSGFPPQNGQLWTETSLGLTQILEGLNWTT